MRATNWQRVDVAVHQHGERRHAPRGRVGEPERAQLVPLILGTFHEMLGTRLSLAEAERMFGVRAATCRVILDQLVRENRLKRTRDGRYTTD